MKDDLSDEFIEALENSPIIADVEEARRISFELREYSLHHFGEQVTFFVAAYRKNTVLSVYIYNGVGTARAILAELIRLRQAFGWKPVDVYFFKCLDAEIVPGNMPEKTELLFRQTA